VSLYRDPLAGLKSQVATKRGLVELRERELAPLIRAMLPVALRQRLVSRSNGPREEETVDVLTAVDAELDALLVAYDEALALAPKLRDCPFDVRDPVKPVTEPPWLIEENRQRAFRVRYEERVREVQADAYVVRWGDVRYLTRMKVAGAPLVAATAGNFDLETPTTLFTSTLRTSVHPAAPAVGVKVKGALHGVAKALRLARDDETGDAAFDEAFMVDGPDGGALLLKPDVTAALRELAPWGVSLTVKSGIAEVTWGAAFRGSGFELLHDAAFSVVLGIRAAIERA
jgi:hypothetical protein